MFQEMAGPFVFLSRGVLLLAEDEDTVDVAGGGGGEVTADDGAADGQDGVVADAGQSEASVEEAPGEEASRVSEEPADEPESEEQSDADEFEAALNDPNLGIIPGSSSSRQKVDYSGTFQSLREGDVVKGTVVHIDRDGVLVDVGTKSEGVIRMHELTRDNFQNPEDVVSVGEVISVFVMETESQDGVLVLSKKRADFEVAWERVEEASKNGKVISAMVTDRVKGGLVVDLGIRGFVPASHVGTGKTQNLDRFIGQSIPLKVIEVDRERRKVVLSHRQAVEEEREKKRSETLESLAEGQQRTGIVRRITEYGAFVDLGGIDGLLHISEMSWTRINHPGDVVKVGDKIQVMVLKMNLENGRLSLGMRQILPDPWHGVGERYHVGDIIHGKISRLVPFGAFVQLEEGVEAIIPNQELSHRRIKKPDQVVSVGDDVEAKILDMRPDERRMTLSTRTLMHERDEPMPQMPPPMHTGGGRDAPRTTVADLLGEGFAERRAEFEREMEGGKAKGKRRKDKARAAERAEEEAYGELSDDELLDLAVDPAAGAEAVAGDASADDAAASEDLDASVEDAVEDTADEAGAVEEAAEEAAEEVAEEASEEASEEAGDVAAADAEESGDEQAEQA